ncbi:uncharacterized protein LOC126036923 [Accipiter gentilis]|uniref:uncharacterized protein LOC126036688 n=1 Tax=Astur gentilis TaxID=8957 RepID=UPI00210FCA52|nr:uncharacterized protein LOC126036688 [Accipiter gentilis]XP_049653100.1 uncharacterized protein LOC126036921 [Accipiter gentilis]XP_049653101.1 uncharacterized protein LOC126036922 [Accipiter gentilis]XP_049653102.1 uncharacterized protein LOC126036923 [Accipiter gentilis]
MRPASFTALAAVARQPNRDTTPRQTRMRGGAVYGSLPVAWLPNHGTAAWEPRMRGGGPLRQRSLSPPKDQSPVLQLGCRACALPRSAKPSPLPPRGPMFGTAARRLRVRGAAPVLHVPSDGTGSAAPGESAAALVASSLPRPRRERGCPFVPGDAADCSSLRLAWPVSARPPSPHGTGAQRDRRSTYWLWTGAAEAGEATER